MKNYAVKIVAAVLGAASLLAHHAVASEDDATVAEGAERLRAIVALVKAKGPAAAGTTVMAAGDPLKCKYKDMVCLLIKADNATFLINTALPKMVGQQFPMDMVDVDGIPIIGQQLGPAKQGKTKWDVKYKFARPDTKKVTPRWSFCEMADAAHVACVIVAQQ